MRHTTGISMLDRTLEGGVPPGDMVAFTAPADTQAELILESIVRQRETVFISTLRTVSEAKSALVDAGADLATLRVRRAAPEDILSEPERFVDQLGEQSNLVIEGVGALETANRDPYLNFLDAVKGRISDTASMGLLYGIDPEGELPDLRSMTLHRADHVWRLYQNRTSQGLQTTMTIPKARGGKAVREPIQLRLTDRVVIDTSRDIG